MPTVILRGSKRQGYAVSRLVLEGSSSSPIRYGDLNGEPFEVSDEELATLEAKYVLEPADGKSGNTESSSSEQGDDNEDDNPEKGGVK